MTGVKQTTTISLFDRRWIGLVYAAFAVALLATATLQQFDQIIEFPPALALLLILLVAAPLTGLMLVRDRTDRWRTLALPLLLVDAGAALGLVALTGGVQSPMWVALLVVSTAAPLLLPGRQAALLLALVWLADGMFLFDAPPGVLVESIATWALRTAGVAVIALVVQRALAAEEEQRLRAQRREEVLHDFLELSNRLRVTSQPDVILSEVTQVVQASGAFDCVTLSRVDWHTATVNIVVAIGAGRRPLKALEGLQIPWREFAPLLHDRLRAGAGTYHVDSLPFRTLKHEQHFLLPLVSQFSEIQGLLTVSFPTRRRSALDEALPLLELLANQAAAALDNSGLYATMEQRVQEATAAYAQGQEELAIARDRAETLYHIVRALSGSLDEREVLAQALTLVTQATGAERGSVLLVEPNTGRLAVRTAIDRVKGATAVTLDRGMELAGVVLASQRPTLIADTQQDTRWHGRATSEIHRSLLAVPLLLDTDPLGVMILTSSRPNHFRIEHQQLVLAAASQVAVALSKAQLYRYVAEQSERLGITLRQREEEISKIQAILRSIGDGVVVGDRIGRIRMLSPSAADMLGISAETLVGRQLCELPGAPASVEQMTAGEAQQVVLGKRTLRAYYTPVVSSGGEWLGGVVVYHDNTREAVAERLKSEFIATASHELRTPLTSIRGYIDLLLLGTLGALTQPQIEFLQVVKNNIARIVELIDDLLDVSRVEAGEVRLRRELLDVAEVVYEVTEALYSQFTERSISLAIDVALDLPRVMADRRRLRQVIVNLVSNACKYTPSGGHVDVVLRVDDEDLRVDVRDTGVGIRSDAQPHIFTPFFRADNSLREVVGGTGLGLSITRSLVHLHGGRIWFESQEGEGAVFSFTLPLGQGEWTPAEWFEQAV